MTRVLVIDDDESTRRALVASLARADFDVTAVDDGAPAIAACDTGHFDLIVSDYNLATTTGAVVVSHYKQRFGPRVYCMVLSGEDNEEIRSKCLAAGADAVLVKPVAPSLLREYLGEAVRALRGLAA